MNIKKTIKHRINLAKYEYFCVEQRVKKVVTYPSRKVRESFNAARWAACQIGNRNFCTSEELEYLNFDYKYLFNAIIGGVGVFLAIGLSHGAFYKAK